MAKEENHIPTSLKMNKEFLFLAKMTVNLQESMGSWKRKGIFLSRVILNDCFLGGPHGRALLQEYQKKGSFLIFSKINCYELLPFSAKYILYSHDGMNWEITVDK